MPIYFKKLECKKCGHTWFPISSINDVNCCPACKNPRWNILEKLECPHCNHIWIPKSSTIQNVGESKHLRCSKCAKQLLVTKEKATKTKITYTVSCNI